LKQATRAFRLAGDRIAIGARGSLGASSNKRAAPVSGFGCLRRPEVGIGRQTAPVSHASCDLKRDDRNNSIIAIDDDHLVADHEVAVAAPLHEGRRDLNDAHRPRRCRAHADGEVDVAGS
jgi:hypothetical protein